MNKVQEITFTKITDSRGDLTFLQEDNGLPFRIKRIFWTYDLKTHSKRGGHAYKTQNEVICVISGSADLVFKDKRGNEDRIRLNRADHGVYIPAQIWRHIENFATNTIMLHISDADFNKDDYVRDLKTYFDEK